MLTFRQCSPVRVISPHVPAAAPRAAVRGKSVGGAAGFPMQRKIVSAALPAWSGKGNSMACASVSVPPKYLNHATVHAGELTLRYVLVRPCGAEAAGAETADAHAEEPPLEHLYEVFDRDESGGMNATELANLFTSLQEGSGKKEEAAADPHAGHADAASATTAATETLSIAHILEDYAGGNPAGLNTTTFLAACPAMLKCAAEPSCEFESEEEVTSTGAKGLEQVGLKVGPRPATRISSPATRG